MVAPIVPAITDHEMPAILTAAANAGATSAGFVVLRLPWAVAPLFEKWLEEHYPDRKEKVMNRVRDLREGKLYDPQWGIRAARQRDLRRSDRIDVRSDVPPAAPQREKVRPVG